MATIDEIIAAAVPRTETVELCARQDLVEAHAAAVARLQDALEREDDLAGSIQNELLEAIAGIEDQQTEHTVTVQVRSVGASQWAELLRDHPPGRGDRGMLWNPRTFPPAAVEACSDLTAAQAAALFERFPAGEWSRLFVTVLSINEGALPHPLLPAATENRRANESSSTTPDPEGSLGERSSDGSGNP